MRVLAPALLAASPALAQEPPRIVADIAPLHSLVAQVAGDAAEPALLLPPGTSPHDFAFRPSDARALDAADVVFWVGAALTPELERPLATLAGDATRVEMLQTPGWTALPYRETALFGPEAAAEEEGDHEHGHGHGGIDPHAWMSPEVARAWLGTIAETLAAADPERAGLYRQNAATAAGDIAALEAGIADRLAPVADVPFLLPHDALHYFDARFGLSPVGALVPSEGTAPGPGRIADLRAAIADEGVACVLSDPETDAGWIALLTEGAEVRTARVDPEGVGLEPGPGLYGELLRQTAEAVAGCLGAP